MYDWGDRSLPVTARLRVENSSSTLVGRRPMGTPLKNMHVEKITGYFRFLPGAARLRSLFFITLGGPQAHGHSLEHVEKATGCFSSLPVTARLRPGGPRTSNAKRSTRFHRDSPTIRRKP